MNKKKRYGKLAILFMAGMVGIITLSGVAMATGPVHNIDKGLDYATIQAAINAAVNGDTIKVDSGIYNENLYIDNKRLNISSTSENPLDTVIRSPDPNIPVVNLVNTVSVNISGFTLEGANTTMTIRIWGASNCTISNNRILSNNTGTYTTSGIRLEGASYCRISENYISNGRTGIAIATNSYKNVITGNIIDSGNYGISISARNQSVINNTIVGFTVAGIHSASSYNVIVNNTIDQSNIGILLLAASYNLITGNTINNTASYGITLQYIGGYYPIGNIVYHNNLLSQSGALAYDAANQDYEGANTWDNGYPSGGNYWSNYSGNDSNNDGIGDMPYYINGINSTEQPRDRYPLMNLYRSVLELNVNITSPSNDSYSEQPVNFSGNVSGGTAPYTYTWTSDIDGTLNTTTTYNTTDNFSKILTIGKHNITLTVQDAAENNATKSIIINAVKQKLKMLVVLTGRSQDNYIHNKGIADVRLPIMKDFLLKSSYGAISLDYQIEDTMRITSSAITTGNDGLDVALTEALNQLYSERGCNSVSYNVILIADDVNLADAGGAFAVSEVVNHVSVIGSCNKVPPVIVVSIEGASDLGMWMHEFYHTLGYTAVDSQRKNTSNTLLWDLYGQSSVVDDLISKTTNSGYVAGWDLMGRGGYVQSDQGIPMDLSSLSKLELGWFTRNEVSLGTYEVFAMESRRYRDPAIVFRNPLSTDTEYVIEARKLANPMSGLYGEAGTTMSDGVVVYRNRTETTNGLKRIAIDNLYTKKKGNPGYNPGNPTFLASEGVAVKPYPDIPNFVEFSVVSFTTDPFKARIKISSCEAECKMLKGFLLKGYIPKWIPGMGFMLDNDTAPNLDLHAYTPSGLHVGMNYTSGEYEMEIPGANASGDTYGEQWIFVPEGTEINFSISSYRVQQYLDEHPEINPDNATINYSVSYMEYGVSPALSQLPDGSYTVSGRNVSIPIEETIQPNQTQEINEAPQWLRYVSGTVMDSIDRTGIPGARVSLNSNISTTTNETGFYSFNDIEGEYNLTVVLDPQYYTNNTITISTINTEITEQDIELVKKPTGIITGEVRRI